MKIIGEYRVGAVALLAAAFFLLLLIGCDSF